MEFLKGWEEDPELSMSGRYLERRYCGEERRVVREKHKSIITVFLGACPAYYEWTTDTAHLAEPLSLWLAVDGTRSEASGIIGFFLCQIDDDRRRDTIQGLRQCKYDKKVTRLPCFSELSVRGMGWATSGGGSAEGGAGAQVAPWGCSWSLSQGWEGSATRVTNPQSREK